jgi:hypothetical protein
MVDGLIDPAVTERREAVPPKDSTTVVKSPTTVEADKLAREAEVQAAQLRTASQRTVNMIWEYTQAAIAVMVVIACIGAAFVLDADKAEILRNAFFLIVGFYFGRTNHQTQGGVGTHEPLQQSGR